MSEVKKRRFGFGRKAAPEAGIDPIHYDVITAPIITEKATMGSEFGRSRSASRSRRPSRRSRPRSKRCSRSRLRRSIR